jgi:hypothetical protein
LKDGGERGQEAGWKTENGKLKTENGLRELPRALFVPPQGYFTGFSSDKVALACSVKGA